MLLGEALVRDPAAASSLPERSARALAEVVPDLEEHRAVQGDAVSPESSRALALEAAVRLVRYAAPLAGV